ncbi:MAG: PQQ-like beta-propeller repeat protein [Planctomycetales bacterium]|nr:PQQ-like beta-propeller repeat protein [Planctomycetales bacterium]
MSRRISLALSLLLLASMASPLWSGDSWPQWRGPNRNGLSDETGLKWNWSESAPKLLWMAEGMGAGYSGVSVDGGMIYTTGNTDAGQSVIAISDAGKVVWTQPLTDSAPKHSYEGARCTPSIDGERLYVVGSHGAIYCLNRGDGAIRWQKDFGATWGGRMMSGWGFSESPLVDGDRVLCTPGGRDAMIVALNKETGDEVWAAKMPNENFSAGKDGAGYSSIVVSNGAGVKQYVQVTGRGAAGVRASDGKVMWVYNRVANRTANIPTAIVDGDYVFCSTGYGTGSALLKLVAKDDGVVAEEQYFLGKNEFQNHHGGMVLVDGHIYAGHGHNNGFPICVNMLKGTVAWGGDVRGVGGGSAAATVADGHLVLRYQTGELAAIKAAADSYQLVGTFKPVFQQGRSWAHPVIVSGRMYLREQDKLMCYELK